MIFEDFLAYLKTLDLPESYQDAIATLKPYGRVSVQFERVLVSLGKRLCYRILRVYVVSISLSIGH